MIEPDQPSTVSLPEPDPRRAEALAQETVALARAGRLGDALHAGTEALRYDPSRWDHFLLRAELRFALDDLFGAYLDATQATLLAPGDVGAWCLLGRIQRKRERWEEAEVACTRALELDAGALGALFERALLRERRGDQAAAHTDFGRWLAAAAADDPLRPAMQEHWEATAGAVREPGNGR